MERGEVGGGGQENTGLPLLPVRQRAAPRSHLPVRVLRRAANHPDGQLPADGGSGCYPGFRHGADSRRRPCVIAGCVSGVARATQHLALDFAQTEPPLKAPPTGTFSSVQI